MTRDDRPGPDADGLAARVADGEAIDWDALDPGGVDDPRLLAGLHHLHDIQNAFRASAEDHDRLPLARTGGGDGVAEPSRASSSPPLFTWGSLEVVREIGRGSSSRVYLAREPQLERDVALKLFDAGPLAASWLDEARRLARVRHPHLLTVYGADLHHGRPGLWTEWIEGMDLEDELRLRGTWSVEEAVEAGRALCGALAALHDAGVVHGDVKPRNVLRERGGRIVLVDLGSGSRTPGRRAGEVDEEASNAGPGPSFLRAALPVRTGTPFALPPERLDGSPSQARDDLYAVGVLLYRMLTDRHPVEAESLEQLRQAHAAHGPVSLGEVRPDLPAALVDLVDRAIARDASSRFDSASAMGAALDDVRATRPRGRSALMVVGAFAVLVALAIWSGSTLRTPSSPGSGIGSGDVATDVTTDVTTDARPTPTDGVFASPPVLLAARDDVTSALGAMEEVAVGRVLHLDVELDRAAHVYVLNEDARGAVVVLFPAPELDLANPLPAGPLRLPGPVDGRDFGWQVSSASGEERILVIASDRPLAPIEDAIAGFPAASTARAVASFRSLDAAALGALRGVAGLAPSGSGTAVDGTGRSNSIDGGFLRALAEGLERGGGDRGVGDDEGGDGRRGDGGNGGDGEDGGNGEVREGGVETRLFRFVSVR